MVIEQILNEIHKGRYEYQVFEYLSKYIIQENTKLEEKNCNYKATIKIIKKINNGKNEFIDNACEVEENDERRYY